ncbi:MAG TPA: hypothetical protein VIZ22_09645 [Candidatus Limnocylindrales bacterium]
MRHRARTRRRLIVGGATLLALLVPATTLAAPPAWTRHLGSKAEDVAGGIAADGKGITIVGTTGGKITHKVEGGSDAFVRRYDRRGAVLWTRQFGTDAQDIGQDVAADGGGVTVLGSTDGSFSGSGGTLGIEDVFVRRYDRDGKRLWTRQFGAPEDEDPGAIAAGDGGLFVVGTTAGDLGGSQAGDGDAFLRRYDRDGQPEWTRQFGTDRADTAMAVAVDGGGITVGGGTDGDLQGQNAGPFSDAFVRRYDLAGNVLWTRQWGQEGDDTVLSLAADGTGVTAVGYTHADSMGNKPSQAFIRRFNRNGQLQWSRIFGSPDSEVAWGVAADGDALTVTGYTFGDLDADNKGSFDVFVRRYNRSGTAIWKRQFGTKGADLGLDVAADGKGFTVFGHTNASLGGDAKGELDVFVRRYRR